MGRFQRLIVVALCSGALAGAIMSMIQHFTVVPLIIAAERYETEDDHHGAEWKPESGWERTGWTVVTTMLTGIGFAALLFGFLGLSGRAVTARSGVLWGLAAFGCFHLAPSLGLPPVPPGVPVSDVQPRQLWWTFAVISAMVGLGLLTRRSWLARIAGVAALVAPHLFRVTAIVGEIAVPADLMRNFALASLASAALFWMLVGGIGGFLSSRWPDRT